jgi:hypothetical protein
MKKLFYTTAILITLLSFQAVAKDTNNSLTASTLTYTDGYGLLPKPAGPSKAEGEEISKEGKQSCQLDCVTPARKLLGTANNVQAYSNCRSECIQTEYSFLNLKSKTVSILPADPKREDEHYIGLVYQCVEYARRWWMEIKGITFGDIDSAYEIIYLDNGQNIYTKKDFPLARSINGTAKRAPQRGDLLVYYPNPTDPKWRYGHVAVIVDVDLEKGIVSLGEQNYSNLDWEKPNEYSRQIRLFSIGGRYRLLDIDTVTNKNINGGLIAGWIYPAT